MRQHRGTVLGWCVVAVYSAALVATAVQAVSDPDLDRARLGDGGSAAEHFVDAWRRSREATFVTVGTYERRSDVTGAELSSEDVVAQRPPKRVHRQLGGVDGRDDDRPILCPAPPAGKEADTQPCSLGPSGAMTYAASVRQEVAGVRSLTLGADPLYDVKEPRPGCFELHLRRIDPRAPFGVAASFCFDASTGAPKLRRVRHEGGIVEVLVVTSIRADVSDADLRP